MADEIDKANESAEIELQARLSKRLPEVKPNGHCLNCEAKLANGKRLFCDAECREDYEHRNRK